jgi:transposase
MNVYSHVASVGMDVHYKFSSVTFRDEQAQIVRRERLDHPDREKLKARLGQWPQGIPIVMEASFGWGWLSDVMVEAGLTVELSNCFKVDQMRQARGGVKTNEKDADTISLLPFEADGWWKVWRAPKEVRNRREQMRYRADLVALQTAIKNQIHSLFHRQGIFYEFSDLFGGEGRRFLVELCQRGSPELSAESLAVLRGQVQLLDHLRHQLADVERTLHQQMKKDVLIQRLKTTPGFGVILSNVRTSEIGELKRFKNDRRLASYCLLAPRANDTGEPDPDPKGRRLGHRGNRTLQWAFIEAAHGAVRSGGLWREMFDRVTHNGRKNRNRGYIKVARKLVRVVYAIWKNGTVYMEQPPARQGRGTKRGSPTVNTRSGMGQL